MSIPRPIFPRIFESDYDRLLKIINERVDAQETNRRYATLEALGLPLVKLGKDFRTSEYHPVKGTAVNPWKVDLKRIKEAFLYEMQSYKVWVVFPQEAAWIVVYGQWFQGKRGMFAPQGAFIVHETISAYTESVSILSTGVDKDKACYVPHAFEKQDYLGELIQGGIDAKNL